MGTYERTMCIKMMITTGRDIESAKRIKKRTSSSYVQYEKSDINLELCTFLE